MHPLELHDYLIYWRIHPFSDVHYKADSAALSRAQTPPSHERVGSGHETRRRYRAGRLTVDLSPTMRAQWGV